LSFTGIFPEFFLLLEILYKLRDPDAGVQEREVFLTISNKLFAIIILKKYNTSFIPFDLLT